MDPSFTENMLISFRDFRTPWKLSSFAISKRFSSIFHWFRRNMAEFSRDPESDHQPTEKRTQQGRSLGSTAPAATWAGACVCPRAHGRWFQARVKLGYTGPYCRRVCITPGVDSRGKLRFSGLIREAGHEPRPELEHQARPTGDSGAWGGSD